MSTFDVRERIVLLMMRGWGDKVRSYDAVTHLFNDSFPDRNPISKSTVVKTALKRLTTLMILSELDDQQQ